MDLSIIVPNYNGSLYLEKCLESLINQKTIYLYEIILIDDCSTDTSLIIIDELKNRNKNKNIKVLSNTNNSGQAISRNYGLECASGNLICFVDSDDFVSNTFVDNMFNGIANNDIGICDFIAVDELGTEFSHEKSGIELGADSLVIQLLDSRCSAVVWDKVYRKDIIDKYYIRFSPNICNEDVLFNFEYMSKINSFIKIASPLVFYRQHSASITKTYNIKTISDMNSVFITISKNISDMKYGSVEQYTLKKALLSFFVYYVLIIGFKRCCKMKSKIDFWYAFNMIIDVTPSYFNSKSILNLNFSWKRKFICLVFLLTNKIKVIF